MIFITKNGKHGFGNPVMQALETTDLCQAERNQDQRDDHNQNCLDGVNHGGGCETSHRNEDRHQQRSEKVKEQRIHKGDIRIDFARVF